MKTRSSGNRFAAALVLSVLIFTSLGCNLSLLNGSQLLPTPAQFQTPTPYPINAQTTAVFASTEVANTATPTAIVKVLPFLYNTQSGDSLSALTAHFGVKKSDITSPDPIKAEGFLNPGQLLTIPNTVSGTLPVQLLLPDSEIVYSPSTIDFNVKDFVLQAGGYLGGKYSGEFIANTMKTGAQVIEYVALDNSINPRLLLAFLEYQSHWVYGQPGNLAQSEYPLGNLDVNTRGLFNQLSWAAHQLSTGYYGWRSGTLTHITFPDGSTQRIWPEVNAGTAAIQYLFASLYNQREWAGALYASDSFLALYERMFGSPWMRAQSVEPMFPKDFAQPELNLPFYFGRIWSFSGGPHAVWGKGTPFAAIDFAPGSTESGCAPSPEWVLAPIAGVVTRSENGLVILDLDGDGNEQTGWVLLFLHIRTDGRADVGARLNKDDLIGHPSCEGGNATGTHFHMARKYNGEWMLADGPVPFVLGGWRVYAGANEYEGSLKKNDQMVTAKTNGSFETQISRPKIP